MKAAGNSEQQERVLYRALYTQAGICIYSCAHIYIYMLYAHAQYTGYIQEHIDCHTYTDRIDNDDSLHDGIISSSLIMVLANANGHETTRKWKMARTANAQQ